MKKLLLALALVPLLFAGCATSGGARQTAVEDFTPAIKSAATLGTFYVLRDEPTWRDEFETALASLRVLEVAERIDFSTILAIVLSLPVDELKSDDARLAITTATILLSGYGGRIIELDKLENVRPVATALREGIELGLKVQQQ